MEGKKKTEGKCKRHGRDSLFLKFMIMEVLDPLSKF